MTLASRLQTKDVVVAPGVYDALTASLAEAAGFEAVYLSGAAISYTRLGRPDIGLVSLKEVGDALSLVRERVELPIVADADTGFGNALNVERTVRMLEHAGAQALQLEDQAFPKRCGHLRGKSLVTKGEMVGKVRAAVDARRSSNTLIIARTDAIAVEGLDPALERAQAYAEAGADLLFVEAPRSLPEMREIIAALGHTAPLMANMVEGGDSPLHAASDLGALGFSLVIFPGGIVRALAKTAEAYYRSLHEHGSNAAFASRMYDFGELNDLLGTGAILARGGRYEDPGP